MNAFFTDLLGKVVTILLTAAGFLGFVAVVGGVTVWFHFYTAELPAVQAIDAMPRSQLLVNGAVPLILFGVLGVLAVAVCYAIDRGGRAREGIAQSLMLLFGGATAFVVLVAPVELRHDLMLVIVIGVGLAVSHLLVGQLKVPDEEPKARLASIKGEAPNEAPYPYQTTPGGLLSLVVVIGVVSSAAAVTTREWWVVAVILVAGALAVINFRIAQGTGNRFTPFAIAVFFSLPLFGAIASLLILANDPLVQPAALIRSADEGRLVVEGIYIADSASHVYFGSVATEGCGSTKLLSGSGTIYAIPKSDVLDIRVGRGQKVADAVRNAPAFAELLVRNAGAFPDRRTPAEKKPAKPKTTKTGDTGTQIKPAWPLRHTRDRAVRQEPKVTGVVDPPTQTPGNHVTVTGENFGTKEGRLLIGGRPAQVVQGGWQDEQIEAIAPPGAKKTSRVKVQCPSQDVVLGVPRG